MQFDESPYATPTNSVYSLAFTTKTQSCFLSGLTLTHSSFMLCFKYPQFQHSCVNLNAAYGNGFGVWASKKRGQVGGVGVVETDNFEEDEGDNDYDDFGPRVKSGVQVQLVNLPKKKNIHKDLKFAFQGIPGIIDIVPVNSGKKKTRDPIYKGFAFIYFKCEKDAARCVL